MAKKKASAAEPAPKAAPKVAPKAAPKAALKATPKAAPVPEAPPKAQTRPAPKVPPKGLAKTRVTAKGKPSANGILSKTLRDAIRAAGLTAYAVGQKSGVDQRQVQRFLSQDRDLRLSSADKIAAVLGLRLVSAERLQQGAPPVTSG